MNTTATKQEATKQNNMSNYSTKNVNNNESAKIDT